MRPVALGLLEDLAGLAASAQRVTGGAEASPNGHQKGDDWLDAWVRDHGVPVAREAEWQGGRKYVLAECPFCGHTDNSAYVARLRDGAVCAGCHHNSCKDKRWPDFRRHYEPGCADRRASNPATLGARGRDVASARVRTPWPTLDDAALYGLPGDLVRAMEAHTEADRVALLANIVVAFGNAAGRNAHVLVSPDRHYLKFFMTLVGETGKGRKGMSWGYPRQIVGAADPAWAGTRIMSGLASGEGVIHHVRDKVMGEKGGEEVVLDPGIEDKRALVFEPEFASALKVTGREGNTLSPVVRQAWDDDVLQTMSKNSPTRATGSHVSIIGHITQSELRRLLSGIEAANGFANRFIYLLVRRSKELPFGGAWHEVDTAPLLRRVGSAYEFARGVGEISWGKSAEGAWRVVYGPLSEGKPGLFGAIVGRAEAQVVRLAALYAVMDESRTVELDHLRAALAVWEYAEESARRIFGDATGDPIADRILDALKIAGEGGMTRTEISALFHRHKGAGDVEQALQLLVDLGRAGREVVGTGGRPAEKWFSKQ